MKEYIIHICLAVILVIGVRAYLNHFNKQEVIAEEATSLVDSMYENNDKLFVRQDISKSEIEKLTNLSNQISGFSNKELKEDIIDLELKYTCLYELSNFYQTDSLLDLREDNVDNLSLNPEVDIKQIQQNYHSLPEELEKEFLSAIKKQYQAIEESLEEIRIAQEKSQQLRGRVNLMGLKQEINKYLEVEELLFANKHHPQVEDSLEIYEEKVHQLAENILEVEDYISVQPETVDNIYSSYYLADALAGADMDSRPLVALTFDDGPTLYTLDLLKVLDKHQVQASFFLLGQSVENHPQIVDEIHKAGHLIGNHSYSHPNFDNLTDKEIINEINRTQDLITEITHEAVRAYRTPYGNGKAKVSRLFPEMIGVFWNVDSTDWVYDNAEVTVETVLETIQHRSIILMHDSKESTIEAIDQLIPQLKEKGYHFVTPDKIPEADNYNDLS